MFCHNCGTELKDTAKFCPRCGVGVYDPARQTAEEPVAPRENVALGTVGAILGAMLGAGTIVLFDQMGIYPAFAGFVLAAATILGYDLLGKRRGASGTVLVSLLILVTPYLAHTLSWVMLFVNTLDTDYTLIQGIPLFYYYLAEGHIDISMYVQELLVLYGFTVLGAVAAFSWAMGRAKKIPTG